MFQIRGEQLAALRRKKIGDALIALVTPMVGAAAWDATEHTILLEDALGPRGHLGFDPQGFLATYTSPLGRTWQLANTPEGKPVHIGSPSGHVVSMAYNEDGLLSAFATTTQAQTNLFYDRHRWAGSTYADSTWDRLDYTPTNDLARVTSRLGTQVVLDYDEHQRLRSLTDGNGQATRFLYGGWSRPDAVVYPNGTGEAFRYDPEGKLTEIRQGDVTIAVEVNPEGRPLELRYNDVTGGETVVRYAYAEGGLVAAASLADPSGELTSTFAYNDQAQVTEETTGDLTHTFTYDAGHRLVALESLGRGVQFAWDADHRLSGFVDWNGGEHTVEYLPGDRGYVTTGPAVNGQLGLRTFAELDVAGHLAGLNVTAAGVSRFSLSASYNNEGRLSTSTDSVFGQRAFTYDADGKLLYADASTAERREALAYDRAGNLVAVNGQRLVYDPANQLLEAGSEQLGWDLRGNLIARSASEGEWQYRYNARNQMIASVSPAGAETTYTYDALGRRTGKRTGTGETRFFWAGEQLVAEVRVDLLTGARSRQDFLYHPETGTPLATCVDGVVYLVHTDQLGTPRACTSLTGEVVWLAELSAFGTAAIVVDRIPMPLRFRGQYGDPETGLHYNRFRYYAPQWGRYTTRDPLTFLAGTNHFQYAEGDPVNNTDVHGLFGWKTVAVIAASVAVAAAVIILAPVAAPIAIILAGAAAGAVGAGLNEALNEKHLSLACIAKAAGLGALAGAAAALPFLLLPATAGVLAFAGAGALGGALSYGVNCADGVEKNPSLAGLGTSMLIGGATAGVLKGGGDAIGGLFSGAPEAGAPEVGSGDVAPETAPESAPDTAPESTPEAAPDTAPEAAPESAPESVPEAAPDAAPESTPESAPETAPEIAEDTTAPTESEKSTSTEESDSPPSPDDDDPMKSPVGQDVYRVDGRPPDVIYDEGFQPKGTDDNLETYANTGNDSTFISTSKTPDIANNSDFASPGKYLYQVDGNQVNGIDVNQALGDRSPYPHEQEIAVPGGIPTRAIISAKPILPGGGLGEAIPNPNYKGLP